MTSHNLSQANQLQGQIARFSQRRSRIDNYGILDDSITASGTTSKNDLYAVLDQGDLDKIKRIMLNALDREVTSLQTQFEAL